MGIRNNYRYEIKQLINKEINHENFTHLSIAVLGLSSAAASAATIWTPTNEDTDFIQFDFAGITTNGGTLALFDESDFGGTALVIGSTGGNVVFTDNLDGSWNAEFFNVTNTSGGSITLAGGNNVLAGC